MARKKTAATDIAGAETFPDMMALDTTVEQPPEARPSTNGVAHSAAEHPPGANGDKRHPVYKVGPIATDRDNSVEAAVWDRVIQTRDGREFTVYSVTVQANWRDSDGSWKKTNNFRGSHLYALVYCLQRCSDWILAQRDPSANCPF